MPVLLRNDEGNDTSNLEFGVHGEPERARTKGDIYSLKQHVVGQEKLEPVLSRQTVLSGRQ